MLGEHIPFYKFAMLTPSEMHSTVPQWWRTARAAGVEAVVEVVPDDVVRDAARVLAHLTNQHVNMENKPSDEALSDVQQNLSDLRNLPPAAEAGLPVSWAAPSEELGYTRDPVTGHITLQPNWSSCKAWIWLLQHRRRTCEAFDLDQAALWEGRSRMHWQESERR